MQLHRLLKMMAGRHWEATAARLQADAGKQRPFEEHIDGYASMRNSLYKPEGDTMERGSSYKGMDANELAQIVVNKLVQTETVYGEHNVPDAHPVYVDAGLVRSMRTMLTIAPITNDNPVFRITDAMHHYFSTRLSILQEQPPGADRDGELRHIQGLLSQYEQARWGMPKLFRGQNQPPPLTRRLTN